MSSRFESFGVSSRWGVHVTPQAGVTMLGRYWTTTSRTSLKRRSIAAHPVASVVRAERTDSTGATSITMTAGRARVLDPLDPATAVADPHGASVIGLVAARIAVDHVDEVIGYGQIARDIPQAWGLRGRVLLSVEPDERLVADDDGIVEANGVWAVEHELPQQRRRARTGPVDLRGDAPAAARELVRAAWRSDAPAPNCSVGLSTTVGPVAFPAVWDPSHGSAVIRRDILARTSPLLDAGACITLDRNADRRADQKVGLILRGRPVLRRLPTTHPLADGHVGVVIGVDGITWWHGFESGTTVVGRRASL